MNIMNNLQSVMEKFIAPVAKKVTENKTISALQSGMMLTMPITLGISVITIISNLPIKPWTNFLTNIGIYGTCQYMMMSTLNMLAIYIVIAVSYKYATNEKENGIIAAILSLATFLSLMPQMVTVGEERVQALLSCNLGSKGVFVSMVVGIVVAKIYCALCKKNLKLKLPDSVPPMVTDSLSPVFISMILFVLVLAVKFIFQLTSYGDIFVFFNTVIGIPIMKFGASPWALLIVYTIANLFWFFGIHPSAVTSVYRPVSQAVLLTCTEAFVAGKPLELNNVIFLILITVVIAGGTGNTVGLAIQSCFAKSEKFRSVGRMAVIPNIFNINEPVIYGFPVMLNPIFFIPMVLSSLIPGVVVIGICKFLGSIYYNPTIAMPWVTPAIITEFLKGGFIVGGLILLTLIIDWLLYLPFFKIADNEAYKEEQLIEKEGKE